MCRVLLLLRSQKNLNQNSPINIRAAHQMEPQPAERTEPGVWGTREPRREYSESPVSWDKLSLEGSRVTLVGFSKGCVVLNQMLYEFHYTSTLTPSDSKALRFINRIEAMYWLDGGHAGGKNTWITARGLLETLSRLDMTIYVHVSPYQVRDESRPWIGREEKAFSTLLKTFRARIHRYMHGRSKSPHSLDMHFEVLANFKQVQDLDPRQQDSSDEEI